MPELAELAAAVYSAAVVADPVALVVEEAGDARTICAARNARELAARRWNLSDPIRCGGSSTRNANKDAALDVYVEGLSVRYGLCCAGLS